MDSSFIIRYCLCFSSFSVWNFGTVWYILFSGPFLKYPVPCSSCMAVCIKHLYGRNRNKWITTFISSAFMYLSHAIGKVCQENKSGFHVFVCDSLDASGGDINHVTFIFPLNLEHGSLPCRIQDWSLTFSLVPSHGWSHFLSIWFLAPYATFLFPACRQQGVALLSPS